MIPRTMGLPRAVALLSSSFLAVASCGDPDPAVLELGGEVVRRSDFERHLAAVDERGLGPVSPEARRGLLDAFLEQRALVIEARRRGLVPEGAGAEDEARAVGRLLAEAVTAPEVTEAEIEAYHAAHAAELAVPETVSLRQILVPTLHQARDVRRRLARNPRAFEAIARAESRGPEAAAGGYMGRFAPGQLPPELESAAFRLPAGGTSDIVETALGYHVMRVESRQPAREPTLEEARETIRGRLAREKRAQAERAFVAGILARSKVNHEAALRPAPPS
jgi:hypothetical protein